MRKFISAGVLSISIIHIVSCEQRQEVISVVPVNWEKRAANLSSIDSLQSGSTYLSVYSQIYDMTQYSTYDLTATISMRNTNRADTIFIEKAEYFDTRGRRIRTYLSKPIHIAPLETVEIVIDQRDKEGGTGANFLFDWKIKPTSNEPFFEGVMISTSGQQGVSFTTRGKRVN